nr:Tetratricopeptide TPR-1 and Tetratricopeptide TPR2 domain containing protein [Haemonchus contortus]
MTDVIWERLKAAHDIPSLRGLLCELPHDDVVLIAQEAFYDVIGANFAGCNASSSSIPSFLENELALLKFDLNEPYAKARLLSHLLFAKIAVVDQKELRKNCKRASLLAFRIVLLWQKMLAEPSVDLKDLMDEIAEAVENNELDSEENIIYLLERANSHLIYFEYEKCADCIQHALKLSNLNMELAGKLGKRTRFQQRDIAQLVLNAESDISTPTSEDPDVPTNCALNDDTLLEKIALAEGGDTTKPLSSLQLAVVLALYRLERRSEHCDELFMERADAYLEAIIRQRRGWAVQAAALLARCDLERTKKRRVERACAQSELICKLIDGVDDTTPIEVKKKRCDLVLASGLEPYWSAYCIHAEALQSLGCTSEALLLYENLEMWDCVIECFKKLGQLEKAEALIRRLLKERPNDSMLYCLLGDITMEPSYYETAMKMTNDRNARARKSLGNLMVLRKQFESAYKHLRRSLELQPIQLGVWFNAGYCAWKQGQYADAVTCFHRCVSLEPEHFEAWNNLSAAYIKLGQKERARKIIQEALKFNYEHPKVWENYLLLCVDTAEFDQAIKAFHRLLDLNKQQKDDEVLEIIASNVLRLTKEASDEPSKLQANNLKSELIKLFGRLSSVQTLSPKAWKLYASLKRPSDDNIEEGEKYVQLLERSLLAESNKPNWSKDVESCCSVLSSAVELASERLRFAALKGEEALKQAKSRVRMSLKPLVTIARREYGSQNKENMSEKWETVNECLDKADSMLREVSL